MIHVKLDMTSTMTTTTTLDPRTRHKIVHALTIADRRQKTNPYALAHYLGALERVDEMMAEGTDLRTAIKTAYCGRLVARLIKAAGLEPLTDSEIREIR